MSEAEKCPEGQGAYPNAGAPGEYQISVGTSELFITNFSRMIVAGSSTFAFKRDVELPFLVIRCDIGTCRDLSLRNRIFVSASLVTYHVLPDLQDRASP
jgi:hypothetical protein